MCRIDCPRNRSLTSRPGERYRPGVAVIRTQEGKIERIDSPIVNSGETDASGVDVRARLDWNAPWADLVLDTRWLRMTQQETRVAGELQPGDYPRARVHGSLRASRGRLTTSWSVYSVSGYWNMRRTGRFDGWMGHDITVPLARPLRPEQDGPHRGRTQYRGPRPCHRSHGPRCCGRESGLGSGAHDLLDRHDVVVREGQAVCAGRRRAMWFRNR